MSEPVEPLVQFANHGFLPFVGRQQELQQIQTFCAGLDEAESLRIALFSGEAGIGKSRLFEEALPGVIEQGACIVRAKLHADTAQALLALLAESLWRSQTTRSILKQEPQATLVSVLQSLRRLARLRKLLVIIEDIHLLSGQSVESFAALVAGLADEPLGMLFSARPATLGIRGIIEPYLALTVELAGLTVGDVQGLWVDLFADDRNDDALIGQLVRKTAGNPLAVRMALRAGIRTEAAPSPTHSNLVTLYLDRVVLENSLETSTRLLAEGMIMQLSEEERESAARLAMLGELVSPEAALIMLGDDGAEALEALLSKGIIAESATLRTPIGGTKSAASPPLVFTHTLLHQHFLEQNRFDINRFWEVLAMCAPLYTFTPFYRISSHVSDLSCPESLLLAGVKAYSLIGNHLSRVTVMGSPQMKTLSEGFQAGAVARFPQLTGEAGLELQLGLQEMRVNLFRFQSQLENEKRRSEYLVLLGSYVELAEQPLPTHLLHHRIWGLAWMFTYNVTIRGILDHELWDRIEEIIHAQPSLRYHLAYIAFLSWVLDRIDYHAMYYPHVSGEYVELLDAIRLRLKDLMQEDEPRMRSALEQSVFKSLLQLYRTPDELRDAWEMYTLYERRCKHYWNYHITALQIFVRAGNVEVALHHNNRINDPYTSDQPLPFPDCYYQLPLILNAVNTPLQDVAEIIRGYWPRIAPDDQRDIAQLLHSYSVLRGNVEWAEEIYKELTDGGSYVEEEFGECLIYWFITGILPQKFDPARQLLQKHIDSDELRCLQTARFNTGAVSNLLLFVFAMPNAPDEDVVEAAIRSDLLNPLSDHYYFVDLIIALIALAYSQEQSISSMQQRLCPEIRIAITRTMNWLIDTRRIVFARIFPQRFWGCFTEEGKKQWLKRIDYELDEQNKRLRPDIETSSSKVHLALLGTVGYRRDDAFEGIKGIRLKQVLGLMTLNAILTRPLSRAEFFAVVADENADDETRRNTVKVAVYQLRKLLGQQSILQREETPQLNLDFVQVDLIDAHRAIVRAESEFSEGSLKNATAQLYKALRLLNGEVAFPTLYDSVFESAREDLETHLRRIIVNVCRALLQYGDEENCEALLRQAVRQLPGDGELDELLLHVLQVEEKRTEGVRMKKSLAESDVVQ